MGDARHLPVRETTTSIVSRVVWKLKLGFGNIAVNIDVFWAILKRSYGT